MTLLALPVTLRPAQPEDRLFQQTVYASTRAGELALVDWNPEQKLAFVEMQFTAQTAHYGIHYPQAEWSIILRDGTPVGRMIVDRSGEAILLIDIALLPEHRHGGIGGTLIQDLMDEARRDGKTLRLHVGTSNPAQSLYRRLGFTLVSASGIYLEMEWRPGAGGYEEKGANE